MQRNIIVQGAFLVKGVGGASKTKLRDISFNFPMENVTNLGIFSYTSAERRHCIFFYLKSTSIINNPALLHVHCIHLYGRNCIQRKDETREVDVENTSFHNRSSVK